MGKERGVVASKIIRATKLEMKTLLLFFYKNTCILHYGQVPQIGLGNVQFVAPESKPEVCELMLLTHHPLRS